MKVTAALFLMGFCVLSAPHAQAAPPPKSKDVTNATQHFLKEVRDLQSEIQSKKTRALEVSKARTTIEGDTTGLSKKTVENMGRRLIQIIRLLEASNGYRDNVHPNQTATERAALFDEAMLIVETARWGVEISGPMKEKRSRLFTHTLLTAGLGSLLVWNALQTSSDFLSLPTGFLALGTFGSAITNAHHYEKVRAFMDDRVRQFHTWQPLWSVLSEHFGDEMSLYSEQEAWITGRVAEAYDSGIKTYLAPEVLEQATAVFNCQDLLKAQQASEQKLAEELEDKPTKVMTLGERK